MSDLLALNMSAPRQLIFDGVHLFLYHDHQKMTDLILNTSQRIQELTDLDRLCDEAVHPGRQSQLPVLFERIGGHSDNGHSSRNEKRGAPDEVRFAFSVS